MNKTEFISAYAQHMKITKAEADRHVRCFLDIVKASLKKGGKVNMIGFGQFKVNQRKARQVRNPRTGKLISVAAKKVPSFTAGKDLKAVVNGGKA